MAERALVQANAEKILRVWQKRLNLEHWDIVLDWSAHSEGLAAIWRADDYDNATVRMGEDWEKRPRREINISIVHELLHVHMRDLDLIVTDKLDGFLHRDVESVLVDQFKHHREGTVDRLAKAIVDGMGVV